jgi:acetyl esterase/lipase
VTPAPRLLRYGPEPSQVVEWWQPEQPNPPVVVLLHGGFWRVAYGAGQMAPVARDLAARGFAVWNVEYRRIGEAGGGWPGTFEDVAAALDLLAEAPDSSALDLGRVAVVGHSAGGHLALWAATRGRGGAPGPAPRVRVAGVVGQAAVSDLYEASERDLSRGAARELLGGSPEQRPERYSATSPRQRLPLGVPTLLQHGLDDDTVPPALSRAFTEAARAAGDACELAEFHATGHMEFLAPSHAVHAGLVAWLERTLRPPG